MKSVASSIPRSAKNQQVSLSDPGFSLPKRIILEPVLEAKQSKYQDSRNPVVAEHNAVDYKLVVNEAFTAKKLLKSLLGKENFEKLFQEWKECQNLDFNKIVCGRINVILFTDSNNKAKNLDYVSGHPRTQEEDFNKAGLEFADDLDSLVLCAVLIKKARRIGLDLSKEVDKWDRGFLLQSNKFNQEELDLLAKLRNGSVQSRSLGFFIDCDKGCFCIKDFCKYADNSTWALGALPI